MPGTGQDSSGQPVPTAKAVRIDPSGPETRSGGAPDPSEVVDELIDTAVKLIGDEDTALQTIKSGAERRIARRAEWGPPAAGAAPHEGSRRERTGQRQGVAMSTQPDLLAESRRPFTGYDRERQTFERLKAELLERAEGKYVVIVGDDVEGPLETFEDAMRAGYRRFGLGALYVKQVLAEEPVAEVSRGITPCRS
jgi:hypothetical protein